MRKRKVDNNVLVTRTTLVNLANKVALATVDTQAILAALATLESLPILAVLETKTTLSAFVNLAALFGNYQHCLP